MSKTNILPGFRPALGFSLLYLSLVVLIPLSTLVFKILQPEEVKDYYDSVLQGHFQSYKNGLFDDVIDEKEHFTNAAMDSARFKQWFSQYDEASHQAYKRYVTGLYNDILNENEHYNGPSRMSFASFKIWYNTYDEKLHQKYSHDYLQGLLDDYILDENEYHAAAVPMDFQRFKDWYVNVYPILQANYERTKKVKQLKVDIKLINEEILKNNKIVVGMDAEIIQWQKETEDTELELTGCDVVIRELGEKIAVTEQTLNELNG